MESQIETISKKEMELRKMKLSQRQEGVTNLTVSNEKERKQLWDEWKTKHPKSKKTWRMNNKQSSKTLRCQATVIIKKVSAIIEIEPANSEGSESIGFGNDEANSEDTNSVHSEATDVDGWANSGDTESIHSEISDIDGLANFGRTNSLGQSPNIERLKKCMEPKDWGETTLQQALQNINNFHDTMLNSKKMIYKSENGEIKDYKKLKAAMKMQSAFNLLGELPEKFDALKNEILTDMSNAYFDQDITYEEVVEKAEKRIQKRGFIMLYTATKISTKQ